jgi:hypothetical protein
MADIDSIYKAASAAILRDSALKTLLGHDIKCQEPFTSSMSSSSVNGKTDKHISLVFPVTGDASSGRAYVSAVIRQEGVPELKQLTVTLGSGRDVTVATKGVKPVQIIDI